MDVDQARESQIRNIEKATGTSLAEWSGRISARREDGLKHGELVQWLKSEFGLTHGNANTLVHVSALQDASDVDQVAAQYSGGKAGLRPIYERLVTEAQAIGDDVEIAPKKTSVSLRRSKQFAVITPASTQRIDLGLNLRGVVPEGRLEGTTGMCTHRVRLTSSDDIDDEVLGWMHDAYDRA